MDDKRPTVLIVEDDVDTQVYMRAVLRRHYDVLVAASGDEFRRQLADHGASVAIVLMDVSLRGAEDGLMLTRELRSSERYRDLPVIATTAHAFAEDRTRVLEAGCNAYLAKPFNHRELFSAMSQLLPSTSH